MIKKKTKQKKTALLQHKTLTHKICYLIILIIKAVHKKLKRNMIFSTT